MQGVTRKIILDGQLFLKWFHKCIIQSGNAFCSWAQSQKSLPLVAEALGIKSEADREVLEILENMSVKELLQNTRRVLHGDDVMYLYKTSTVPQILPNSTAEKTMRRFVIMWTNFAISGNPNFPEGDALKKIK
ncbi:hypothetical protein FQR65_LT09435 [Abscondita terminalis]|nr:hypothetical protein FQR65_LT09435 [Abscondita terminalis]